MNSKIVILDDSVILYQHYTGDENWESVMAFPRGGLTYLIKNNNIKFYAYVDYFYKNCLMTMDLPIYIVDEELGIDGEYDDIQEITEILNRIFPANGNGDVDLTLYLKKKEAEETYQPIGDYAKLEDIPDVPSLDGYATETWVQNQGYIDQIKTINGISLVGEGNINIGSGGTIDAYSKAEADERFQPKGEYVTSATVIQYITNLQQQIESIIESVSGCCSSSGETIYRWITMTGDNDYICSGTTKYAKEKKQQSTDNGMTWTDVSPAEYQRGTLIETQSTDCGYEPTIEYRWVTVPGGYVCSGTTKYNQEKKQYRVDGGSWIDTNPLETRQGSTVIETQSTDCGYIAPQYRWYQAPETDYICSGTTKYYKEYYQVSNDGGNTWQNVTPTQTRTGSMIETQSTDCGYVPVTNPISTMTYKVSASTSVSEKTKVVASSLELSKLEVQLTAGTYTSIDISSQSSAWGRFTYNSENALGRMEHASTQLSHGCMFGVPLTSINVGEGITKLDDQCLYGNDLHPENQVLRNIVLPSTLTDLSYDAIDKQPNLETITVNAITPPAINYVTVGYILFRNCPNITAIYVPRESVEAYKAAPGWSTKANLIQAIP